MSKGEGISGGEALVDALKSNGVECIFSGGGFTPLQDVLIDHEEISYFLALHEAASVSIAEGYALATGKAAVATVHVAVGTANAIGGIFAAYRDGTPLVVIAGERQTSLLGRRSYNESPALTEMPRQFAKQSRQVQQAEKIHEDVSRAIKLALSPPSGPVFLALPMDFFDARVHPSNTSAIPSQSFARSVRGDPRLISRAAELILGAENPIIVIGRGVARARASADLFNLAEAIAAPVFLEGNSHAIDLPTDHPLFLGDLDTAFPAVRQADLAISIGGRLTIEMEPQEKGPFGHRLSLVQINENPEDISLVYPAAVAVVSDSGMAIRDLLAELQRNKRSKGTSAREARMAELKKFNSRLEDEVERRVNATWDDPPVSLGRFTEELSKLLDSRKDVLVGQASGVALARHILNLHTVFLQNGAGYQGWTLGCSVGVKLGMPDRQVVCMLGDGNVMFGPQALWTAARYRVGVKVVVVDNGVYRSEITTKNIGSKNLMGADIGDPEIDFVKLAGSMGVRAATIDRPADISRVLKQAFSSKGPYLIDLKVGRENPNLILKDAIKSLS